MKSKKVVIRFDGSPLSRDEIEVAYKEIKKAYKLLDSMPEKKRRSKETRELLVKLAMLEGLLGFFENQLNQSNLREIHYT